MSQAGLPYYNKPTKGSRGAGTTLNHDKSVALLKQHNKHKADSVMATAKDAREHDDRAPTHKLEVPQ
jgi:hypothetical protein